MKLLHTSDWHLGRTLYGRKRYEEFEAFLLWLVDIIRREKIDALLIAGDVFDSSAPSNRAQELYYRFLCNIANTNCRHVAIIAGNHDSPSFLNAPKELLRQLDVHVVGCMTNEIEDEVLCLKDKKGAVELIVCAVPYLRDRDIRLAEAGESIEDKERKLLDGIRGHYQEIGAYAVQKRRELNLSIPIVGMGHLFTAGGQTIEGDGVRGLYVGSLAHLTAEIFPKELDYLALGHLHIPQKVNGLEHRRYSGSPLPMGFGEAKQQKSVCVVTFIDHVCEVELIPIPIFQHLERVHGNWERISAKLNELITLGNNVWLEVIYESEQVMGDLREQLDQLISGTAIEILRIKDKRIAERVLNRIHDNETLDDLNEHDVFRRCLETQQVPEEQRMELRSAYQEILQSLNDEDRKAN